MRPAIKICGVTTAGAMDTAARAGATHVGFVFHKPSPRVITPADAAAIAARHPNIAAVALVVDASDAEIGAILKIFRPSLLQLHGRETPARIAAVRHITDLPVMKAMAMAGPADVEAARDVEPVADMLLFDAAPGILPGGNGLAFDWNLLKGRTWQKPWLLSGGLTPENVATAIYQTKPGGVDVSSGVERARGVKDESRIAAFITSAREAFSAIAGAQD
jgi:phosphoribosylanthranilate isomerase